MIDKTTETKGLGLPNQSANANSTQFIGRKAYLKELEDTMRSEVVKFPRDTTPQGIVDYIKQLAKLRAVLDALLHSSVFSKYEILTNLQVIYHNITSGYV